LPLPLPLQARNVFGLACGQYADADEAAAVIAAPHCHALPDIPPVRPTLGEEKVGHAHFLGSRRLGPGRRLFSTKAALRAWTMATSRHRNPACPPLSTGLADGFFGVTGVTRMPRF